MLVGARVCARLKTFCLFIIESDVLCDAAETSDDDDGDDEI